MKKRLLTVAMISAMCLGSIFAGGASEAPATKEIKGEVGGTLEIWSFTNEMKTFALAYQEAHPNVDVEYTNDSNDKRRISNKN